jgi:hypothetical protein
MAHGQQQAGCRLKHVLQQIWRKKEFPADARPATDSLTFRLSASPFVRYECCARR